MLLVVSDNTDVYFNLAAEEYMLHEFTHDVLMIWRSKKAVVCGKHQNLCSEVNYGYCRENGIDIARRLTGGGTVFHDDGNVNFTFIQTIQEGLEYAVDYKRFLEPIREALLHLGVNTEYSQRNDLLIKGKKISGNAEHVLQKKKRVLHHGTLLFNSNLQQLGKTLRPNGVYTDKAVKSVRSEVTNIHEHYSSTQNTEYFIAQLVDFFQKRKHTNRYVLNFREIEAIEQLKHEKYMTSGWILGYSPAYHVQKTIEAQNGSFSLQMRVSKGIIDDIQFTNSLGDSQIETKVLRYKNQNLTESLSKQFAHEFFRSPSIELSYCLF